MTPRRDEINPYCNLSFWCAMKARIDGRIIANLESTKRPAQYMLQLRVPLRMLHVWRGFEGWQPEHPLPLQAEWGFVRALGLRRNNDS